MRSSDRLMVFGLACFIFAALFHLERQLNTLVEGQRHDDEAGMTCLEAIEDLRARVHAMEAEAAFLDQSMRAVWYKQEGAVK